MKKMLTITMIAVAALMICACNRCDDCEPGADTPEIPTTLDILHTTWQGVYQGSVVHPQAGALPCVITWTLDFVDETNVSILCEMTTGGQAQQPQELACTYTYDGLKGEIISEEGGEIQRDAFEVDPVNRTFTIDFRITTGFSQEEPQVVGGPTVFHQIH